MTRDISRVNTRNVRARTHLDTDEFINKLVLDRDASEYPDPFIRDVDDVSLLKQYLSLTVNAIRSYTPSDDEEAEACREFRLREQKRVNAQIGRLTFPEPTDGDLPDLLTRLEHAQFSTGYLIHPRDISWNVYADLYTRPIDDLRHLAAYFRASEWPLGGAKFSKPLRILNAIRYVRDDPAVSLNNIVSFASLEEVKEHLLIERDGEPVELTEGVEFDRIEEGLNELADRFDSLIVALAFANIGKITNYRYEGAANGVYKSLETNFSELIGDTDVIPRNIVAHEFFHSIQDIIGAREMMVHNDAVELQQSPDEWEVLVYHDVTDDLSGIHETMKQQWFEFRLGNITPLCEYQTKNINELFAVAFELYVEDPDALNESQPQIYSTLSTLLETTPSR